MSQKKATDWFWPKTIDPDMAKFASRFGMWAAAIGAVMTATISIFGQAGYFQGVPVYEKFNLLMLLDAAIFAAIAWGIYKFSRTAAIAGLVWYVIERADMWSQHGPQNLVVAALFVLMYVNGIRGTIAHHEFIAIIKQNDENNSWHP